MIDLYLVAADEPSLAAALPWARGTDRDGAPCWYIASEHYALDLIGPMVLTPPVLDGDGNVMTEAVLDNRYHANLRLIDDALADRVPVALRVQPSSPSRVWAA